MQLKDKVAIVTGGASGFGAATARQFAQAGAAVMVADLNLAGAQDVDASIRAAGGRAAAMACDVRTARAARTAVVFVAVAGLIPASAEQRRDREQGKELLHDSLLRVVGFVTVTVTLLSWG